MSCLIFSFFRLMMMVKYLTWRISKVFLIMMKVLKYLVESMHWFLIKSQLKIYFIIFLILALFQIWLTLISRKYNLKLVLTSIMLSPVQISYNLSQLITTSLLVDEVSSRYFNRNHVKTSTILRVSSWSLGEHQYSEFW